MSAPVVTRFAPSPTGFLHIGGARTALFNWLYARHTGGRMLLRIEDTDKERSTEAAIAAILDGLTWLGIEWDDAPVFQSLRADRHAEVAYALLESGQAYRCYASAEELTEMREKARAEGRPPLYDRRWRDRDPSEAPEGVDPVIRIKAPLDGETVIDDHVQGRVSFANKDLDDFIIMRSDGSPTYMHAVVVDDHDMEVSHIVRGDDHLTNAARQTLIYKAMGWDVPSFAHIPLIHGPDGAKLSKRHGALGVEAYRAMGYLPEALRNYLVRLGWSHGDTEIFSTEEMIEWFDLDQIGRSPARFDFAKLENLSGHYIRSASDERLLQAIDDLLPHLEDGDAIANALTPDARTRLTHAMPGLKERAKTLLELLDAAAYVWVTRPITPDEKAGKVLDADARTHLKAIADRLSELATWTAADTESVVRAYAEETSLKLGKVAQPLRCALTGRTTSPPVFDVLETLGREESLARIRDQAA
ncbi:glutamate--tRNA ligase [Amorphus orientalis]|uniref:Glutamate--tRNA ligase n=1 Tax=Amorphus orientalis TaxID=649198 RepID=A0AAE3VNX8_9HYPH|nr:glutamate--tRNA ligase [Amorphus orientalis]MDQ0315557.1 glutamyl-tRNA synthetase [Amorphus orientalis]